MNRCFKKILSGAGWEESRISCWVTKSEKLIRKVMALPPDQQKKEIEAAGETPIFSYNQTDYVKERIVERRNNQWNCCIAGYPVNH
jgi:hypothetical protein